MQLNTTRNWTISQNQVNILNIAFIVVLAIVPLLMKYPFNINIFLAWEGAYRIYLGQIPSVDFYLPMGFVFWLLPALFFKLFGPYLFTLIIFQSFVNLITLLTFRYILRLLRVNHYVIYLSTLVLGLSYVLLNFWPWYNNFVFVLQLVSILFLLLAIASAIPVKSIIYLIIASGFSIFSFFTKQDAGGLTIFLNVALVGYISIRRGTFTQLLIFIIALVVWAIPFTLPFLTSDIMYWFNYGQEPHYSRLNLFTYLSQLFQFSNWIKFYLLIIVMGLIIKYKSIKELFRSERDFMFLILIIGILFQASVIQVTSYIPHYSHFYMHGFAFAYILGQLNFKEKMSKLPVFVTITIFTVLLWSADTWKYGLRLTKKLLPETFFEVPANVVSKNTWLNSESSIFDNRASWRLSNLKSLKNIYLPPETLAGIKRLVNKYGATQGLKVLNMSELTTLAVEIGYSPLVDHPLWYHKNVAIFEKEIIEICNNIVNHKYDVVLFESIPILNGFYPEEINQCLIQHYTLVDEFRAPRREKNSTILVYQK